MLSERDFQCYVLDDWDWKQKFLAASASTLLGLQGRWTRIPSVSDRLSLTLEFRHIK
jgi:hypothetical protein